MIIEILISILISLIFVAADWIFGHHLIGLFLWWRRIQIQVISNGGTPNLDAEVTVSGSGRHKVNKQGWAKIFIPRGDIYGVQVHYPGYEAGHYMLPLKPGKKYHYGNELVEV